MTNDYIIDVTEADFEYEVVAFPQNTPVVIEFWAAWSKACSQELNPLLENLVRELEGGFRLARVNVDAFPNLALRFGVHSIPTLKVMTQGEVVGEFVGVQNEQRLRAFIASITPPSPINLAIEKANSLLALDRIDEAESLYEQVLQQSPESGACLLGLAKIALLKGRPVEADHILRNFPSCKEYSTAETLMPLVRSMLDLVNEKLPRETDPDIAFENCIRLTARGNLLAALDGLMDILRQDKSYRHNIARQIILAIFELLGNDSETVHKYRREMVSILF